jgi:zinc transport system substrate-binding protein
MKSSRKAMIWLCSALLALALAPLNAHAEKELRVVATIAPLYALTAGVMGDVGEPELLLKGGTPHHYSMRPADVKKILSADMLICLSKDAEYYLKPLLRMTPARHLTVIEALATPGIELLPASQPASAAEEKDHAAMDIHFWLNPTNAIAFTHYIAMTLSAAYPEHSAAFMSNAQRQEEAIKALDVEIRALLGSSKKKPLKARYAVYHPSLGYFEKYYHIEDAHVVTRTPESGPSAPEAEALIDGIKAGNIRCMFREQEFSARLIGAAAERHSEKVTAIAMDTLGSSYPINKDLYPTMLRDIAGNVAKCSENGE